MGSLLIINGHPREGSLCDTLEQTYYTTAREQGAEVAILRIRDLDFNPHLYSPRDQSGTKMELPLKQAQTAIQGADHLVWIYPNWWGTFPALMGGFIDRILTPGFAFKFQKGSAFPEKLLKGKTARLMVTMDGPGWWYRWVVRAGGDKAMRHSTLEFCGIRVTGILHLGSLRGKGSIPVHVHQKRVVKAARRDALLSLQQPKAPRLVS